MYMLAFDSYFMFSVSILGHTLLVQTVWLEVLRHC
ncbi:unnamed protein product [Schistosoma curassoni]|uniref:Uncharacterized protein n=1 Tax=Schistosoma curassoni TaxID=6186 RepID=A0A183L1D7_9TREM|nr:unnamed protein product [Schistosoma curassoni]